MVWKDIIGHEEAIGRLENAIEKNQISHSYLFQGEESIGKKKLALTFSKTLLCQEKGTSPCNKCISCRKFDAGNHPDFSLIESENGLIKKDRIDQLIKSTKTYPLEGDRKIVLIDNSEDMRMESQNALLKTLEEPAAYMNFILINSRPKGLISTIESRCYLLKLHAVDSSSLEAFLREDYSKSKEEAKFIANFTKGSVGRSIRLSESDDFFTMRNEFLDIIDSLLIKKDLTRAFSSKDFFKKYKDRQEELLDILIYWFRDLYLYKEIGESDLLVNIDRYESLEGQSFLSFAKINDIINSVIDSKRDLSFNVNYQLRMETMLLNMQEV